MKDLMEALNRMASTGATREPTYLSVAVANDRTDAYIATVSRAGGMTAFEENARKMVKYYNDLMGTSYYIKAQGRGDNRLARCEAAGLDTSRARVAQSLPLSVAPRADLYLYTR